MSEKNLLQRVVSHLATPMYEFGSPAEMEGIDLTLKGQIGETWADRWLKSSNASLIRQGVFFADPYNQNIWAYAAIQAIATNITAVPLKFFSTNSQGEKKVVEPESTPFERLFRRPNQFMSFHDLRFLTHVWLDRCGEAFWILERNNPGQVPETAVPANPAKFEPIFTPDKTTIIGWKYQLDRPRNGEKFVNLQLFQVAHFKYTDPEKPWRGMAPHTAARNSLELDVLSDEFNKQYFKQGAIVGMRVETDKALTDIQFNRMKEQINQTFGRGVRNAHKIALLEAGAKLESSQIALKDMAFGELKNMNRKQIIAAYNVPEVIIGFFGDVNSFGDSTRQIVKMWWNQGLMPRTRLVERSLQVQLIDPINPSLMLEHDLDNVEALQEDEKDKIEKAKEYFGMGVPLNQLIKSLDLPIDPVEGGDVGYLPLNLRPITEDLLEPDPEPEPEEPEEDETEDDETGEEEETETEGEEEEETEPERNTDAIANTLHWKRFLTKQIPLEKQFVSKLKRWLINQRKKVLKNLEANLSKDITADILDADTEVRALKKLLRPLYEEGLQIGVELVLEELGIIEDATLTEEALAFSEIRLAGASTQIMDTIEGALRNQIVDGLAAGDSVQDLAERVKGVYKVSQNRALTIARTESASMINKGKNLEQKRKGVEATMWISARDDAVRDSHAAQDGLTAPIGQAFPNGQEYPNDTSGVPAEEFINCRCIAVSVRNDP